VVKNGVNGYFVQHVAATVSSMSSVDLPIFLKNRRVTTRKKPVSIPTVDSFREVEVSRPATSLERAFVAGLPVIRGRPDSILELLWRDAYDAVPHVYMLVNAHSATLRRTNPAYADALLQSDGVVPVPDGASIALGARLIRQGGLQRFPGPDLMEQAAARAGGDGTGFYLLGGGPKVADQLAEALRTRHPGLCVCGVNTPPFGDWSDEESREMVDRIRAANPAIVWIGVSAPKQEVWALRWCKDIHRPIVCVGAAFDYLSGTKRRAPQWMRQAGLEWLFRLGSEPQRLWRRYIVGNPVFLADLVRYRGRAPVEHELPDPVWLQTCLAPEVPVRDAQDCTEQLVSPTSAPSC
jgi:N-acetylglucosaminyldiphosphoundecaprenol N-acetyl-beta-D-mannosaminyltransferase